MASPCEHRATRSTAAGTAAAISCTCFAGRAVAPQQCTCGEVGPREPIADQELAFLEGVIQLVQRGHQTLLGLTGRLGVYVHQRGHGSANLGVDEREQRPPVPRSSVEQESESAVAIRKRVVVEPEPHRNADLVVQVLLPSQALPWLPVHRVGSADDLGISGRGYVMMDVESWTTVPLSTRIGRLLCRASFLATFACRPGKRFLRTCARPL